MIETGWVSRFAAFCIRRRAWVVSILAVLTAVLTYFALHVEVKTVFADMLPSSHSYVKTHERFKDTFGGSNIVTIMVEVGKGDKGDIFQPAVLEKVRTLHALAQERGQSLAQMSLAWALRGNLTSALIGASRPSQITENAACLSRGAFSPEELQRIDAILDGRKA